MRWVCLVLCSAGVLAAAPVNLARGRPYTSSVAASSSYPDSNGNELTNGIEAYGDLGDSQWQGRMDVSSYSHIVDLGEVSPVVQVSCRFLQDSQAWIYWPGAVTFSFSKDGVAFTDPQNAAPQSEVGAVRTYLLQLVSAVDARYVRMTVNGTAWIFEDELQVWGTAPTPRILSGSYLQPWLAQSWTAANFFREFNDMRSVGMDHLVWQWTANSKDKTTYYPTGLPGFRQLNNVDSIGISLAQAQQCGLKVWLGLNDNPDWWSNYANDPVWLQNEFNISKQIAQELWDRYGVQYGDVIAGFYLSQEVDNWNFSTTVQQDNLKSVYQDVVDYIHIHMNKPVMVSPFFNESGGLNATQYAAMWQTILTSVPMDVIALQDGIGVGHAQLSTVGQWFSAFQNAIASARPATELWSNLETFDSLGAPAPIDRVIRQIDAEKDFVTKFTCFSFNSYDSPQQGFAAEYTEYKTYVDSLFGNATWPVAQIRSPAPGSTVSGTVLISSGATDDVGVTRMELYVDGALKATSNNGSLSWNWRTHSVKGGAHTILVNAYDADNHRGSSEITVYK